MHFLLPLLLFVFSLKAWPADEASIKSTEEILFTTPSEFPFLTLGRIKEFKGQITRTGANLKDLAQADFYQFKSNDVKIEKYLCAGIADKIFALKEAHDFQLNTFVIYKSNKGKVCEMIVHEKFRADEQWLRFITIGFVNAKLVALVYKFNKINLKKIRETRSFWNTLR